jgi:gas vesicle protein
METFYLMMPLFISIFVLLVVLLVSVGVVVFLRVNKIITELNSLKVDLSFHSQNVLEETVCFDTLSSEVKNLSNNIEKTLTDIQNSLETKVDQNKENKWDSVRKAFSQEPRPSK